MSSFANSGNPDETQHNAAFHQRLHCSHLQTKDYNIFSSPEPKAQGELIIWDSSRRPCMRPSVNTFKHEYL